MRRIELAGPEMAIIVVNYKTAKITCDCLDAVERQLPPGRHELIVVDNASGDGSVAEIRRRHPRARILAETRNHGFGVGNNRGVAATSAPYVVLLNSDAMLETNTPQRLVDYLKVNRQVACVGPRVNLSDGTRQPRVHGHSPTPWRIIKQSLGISRLSRFWRGFDGIDAEGSPPPVAEVGWISGVCMAMRTADYRAVGGFDPEIFMYCEDVDLCMRLRQRVGTVVHVDDWAVTHLGGASSRSIASRLRNAVWQQRNMLAIIRRSRGRGSALVTRLGMAPGQVLRLALGFLRLGADDGFLFWVSLERLLDLLGLSDVAHHPGSGKT